MSNLNLDGASVAEDRPSIYPDFAIHKMCRNFDALLDWAKEHKVADQQRRREEMLPQDGETVVPWMEM